MATADDRAIRRTLLGRIWAIVGGTAAFAVGVGFVVGISVNGGDLDDLRHARHVAATEPHVDGVVIDVDTLPKHDARDVGWLDDTVRLPDGTYADVWTNDRWWSPLDWFGGPDVGDRLTVAVDPDREARVILVDDVDGSVLGYAVSLLLTLLVSLVPMLLLLRRLRYSEPPVPFRGALALLNPSGHMPAVVVGVLHADPHDPQRVTFRIRSGDHDYSWDAFLPAHRPPVVGDPLELSGDLRDGGWVLGVDHRRGVSYPRGRLRRWGSDLPTTSWHSAEHW